MSLTDAFDPFARDRMARQIVQRSGCYPRSSAECSRRSSIIAKCSVGMPLTRSVTSAHESASRSRSLEYFACNSAVGAGCDDRTDVANEPGHCERDERILKQLPQSMTTRDVTSFVRSTATSSSSLCASATSASVTTRWTGRKRDGVGTECVALAKSDREIDGGVGCWKSDTAETFDEPCLSIG